MSPVEIMLDVVAVVLGGAGLVLPAVDHVARRGAKRFLSPSVAIVALACTLVVACGLAYTSYGEGTLYVYRGALQVDFYGCFLAVVVNFGALLVAWASLQEAGSWPTAPSYYSLLLLALLGVYYMLFVADLALLLASWALVSVASYVLVGMRKDESSAEGATKYALMGVAASSIMLYGVAIIFGMAGTTSLSLVEPISSPALEMPLLLLVGAFLLTAAFGFKLGVVPFHGWLPDVYGGVHPILVSYIAGVVKVMGVAAILRVVYPLSPLLGEDWLPIFAVLSIATMTFGNLVALVQRGVQRMMAYSSMAQAGYILVGFASAASVAGRDYGLQGVALHVTTYMLAKVGIFVALACLARKGVELSLEGMRGVGRKMPILSFSIAILMFSLMGIPPLVGFWSKFIYLFTSVIDVAPWLALIAVINSGISVGYYVQVLRAMYFAGEGSIVATEDVRDHEVVVALVTALLSIILGLGPILLVAPYLTS